MVAMGAEQMMPAVFLLLLASSPQAQASGEQSTHLHFFFHDITSGANATAVRVTSPERTADPTMFGAIVVMDDLLTEGPDRSSRPVGRAQGIYASADQTQIGFLQAMNLVFTDGAGAHNGSTLTVLGRNPPLHDVREMTVVGGTGAFRMARGYALAHTHGVDTALGDVVVEYNVYVVHSPATPPSVAPAAAASAGKVNY